MDRAVRTLTNTKQEFRSSEVQKYASGTLREQKSRSMANTTLCEQEWKSARRKQQSHELFCNSCNFCNFCLLLYSVTPATSATSVFFFIL
jgi:hypothetical protein